MTNHLFKIALFDSNDFDFFRSADFVGDRYLVAVAVGSHLRFSKERSAGDVIVSAAKIPAEKKNSVIDEKIIFGILDELSQKLFVGAQIHALFNCTQLETFTWNGMQSLKGTSPRELLIARETAQSFLLLKEKERALEFPNLPWKNSDPSAHTAILAQKSYRALYDLKNPQIAAICHEHDRKRKLLLHVCCGPDAAGVIEQLKSEFDLVCFWYDPNIQPREEYDKRLDAFLKVVQIENTTAIVGEYDVENFFESIRGLEHTPEQGAKCSVCYDMRLERSAIEAKKQNCDLFATTLAISPHKVQKKLENFGNLAAKKHGVPYLARNFMKEDGFKDSLDYCKEHNIFRQDYCGCIYSLHEGGPDARAKADQYDTQFRPRVLER